MGAVQLALFESVKSFVINSRDIDFDVNTLIAEAIFGSIGGAVGALISTPGDIVTIQMMASLENCNDGVNDTDSSLDRVAFSSSSLVGAPSEESAFQVARRIYEEKEPWLSLKAQRKECYTGALLYQFFCQFIVPYEGML